MIEILIVLVVISILAALLFPAFMRSREMARRSACMSNLKQIGAGLSQYVQDYDSRMPPRYADASLPSDKNPYNWRVLIHPYLKSREIFRCPSNPESRTSATTKGEINNGNNGGHINVGNGNGGGHGAGGVNNTGLASGSYQPIEINVSYACNYSSSGLGVFENYIPSVPPTNVAEFAFPAETISVAETTSTRPDLDMSDASMIGQLYAGHLGTGNYLFLDGHVKALRPLQTYYSNNKVKNMWHRDHSPFTS